MYAENSKKRGENSVTYQMGRVCHTRTELYHRLHHSKYRLIKAVEKKLHPLSGTPESVLECIINDQQFVDDLFSRVQDLLQEADDFAKLKE